MADRMHQPRLVMAFIVQGRNSFPRIPSPVTLPLAITGRRVLTNIAHLRAAGLIDLLCPRSDLAFS